MAAPVRLQQADVVVPDPRLAHRADRHPWHELNLILEGRYRARMGEEVWECGPGTGVLIPAGQPHRPLYRKDRSVKLLNLQWTGGSWPTGPLRIPDHDGRLTQAIRWLIDRGPLVDHDHRRLGDNLLRAVLIECRLRSAEDQEDLAVRIRRYIHDRMVQSLSMGELSRTFGLSERRIHQIFRERFGQAPMAHLAEVRVDAAMAMLRDSDATLDEIARRLGWTDRGHLSRLIKRRYGRSPSTLRRG